MPRRPKAEFEVTAIDRATATLRSIDGTLGGLTRTAVTGARALGGIAVGAGVAQVGLLADEYNQLTVRVRTATKETGDFDEVLQELTSTSIETGTAFETTVDTFQALSRIREDVGGTNEQMLALTRTVQQLGVIGGTSNEALNNGLRQFNQAVAAGIFRAEEFNSIVENVPELAFRIAEGFNATQGELRQMVLDGQLFADDVINTLLRQAPQISAEFEEIPNNLDRAFNALQTSIGQAASAVDSEFGVTEGFADIIENLAEGIRQASGNTTELEDAQSKLNEQLAQSRDLQRLLNREFDFFTEAARAVQGLPASQEAVRREWELLQRQIAETRAEVERLRGADQDVGQVGGNPREAAETEVNTKLLRQRAVHFEKLIEAEARHLEAVAQLQNDARIRTQELLDQEFEQLQANQLARALGFEDEKAQLIFDREEELHQARLEEINRRLEEELAVELGFEDRRSQELAAAEQLRQEALVDARLRGNRLAQRAISQLRKFEEAQGAQKVNVLLAQAQLLTQGLATSSKAAFNINKAAALASAIINTAEGVTKALASQNYAAAALTAAMGAAQIATISSTSFGGGSGGASAFGASSGIPSSAGESPLRDIPVFDGGERSSSEIVLRIEADDSDLSRVLAESIRTEADEGDIIILSERSRNAGDLGGGL